MKLKSITAKAALALVLLVVWCGVSFAQASGGLAYPSGSGGGGSPTGSAGGDLGGTYPNPTVVSVAHVSTGTLPIANGGTGAATTSQNFAFIGPTSGSGAPSFRLLTAGDLGTTLAPQFSAVGIGTPAPGSTSQLALAGGDGTHPSYVGVNTGGCVTTFSGECINAGSWEAVAQFNGGSGQSFFDFITSTTTDATNIGNIQWAVSGTSASDQRTGLIGMVEIGSNATAPKAAMQFLTANGGIVSEKMRISPAGGLSVGNTTDPGVGVVNPNAGLKIASDNTVASMARMPLSFDPGSIATVTTGTNFGVYKVVKALTIENYEGTMYSNAGCTSGGAVVRLYDCGASAPANAACSGGTQLTTVSLGTTNGTTVDGTINSANVAAGEYIGAQIQASGSCTAIDFDVTAMARPQ